MPSELGSMRAGMVASGGRLASNCRAEKWGVGLQRMSEKAGC